MTPTNPPQYSIEDLGDSKSPLIASKSDVVKSLTQAPSKRCEWCGYLNTRFGGSPYMADPHDMCIDCYMATWANHKEEILPFEMVERI